GANLSASDSLPFVCGEHEAETPESRRGSERGRRFSTDVAEAVALDHPSCTDASCDIREALDAGFPLTAAWLLWGATETPTLDAVLKAHEPARDWAGAEREGWEEHIADYGRSCSRCGGVTFADPYWEPDA